MSTAHFNDMPCILVGLVAILMFATPSHADQTHPRLVDLFHIIKQSQDAQTAYLAESEIWQLWLQHDNQHIQTRLAEAIAAMDTNPRQALGMFTAIVTDAPKFAEGWNKRATLFFLLGNYDASAKDIDATLALEPRHFGALSGLGLVRLAQNQYMQAKAAFEAALAIHPHSPGVRKNIELIDDFMRRSTI